MIENYEFDETSYTIIDVLEFLRGKPWNEYAAAYVHGLRPSEVRVLKYNQGLKCDARVWRVTVKLTKEDVIDDIQQEIEVGCPDGKDGYELDLIMGNNY